MLAAHFLARFRAGGRRHHGKEISAEALDRLASYDYPGNVRELKNVVERAVYMARARCSTPPTSTGALPPAAERAGRGDRRMSVRRRSGAAAARARRRVRGVAVQGRARAHALQAEGGGAGARASPTISSGSATASTASARSRRSAGQPGAPRAAARARARRSRHARRPSLRRRTPSPCSRAYVADLEDALAEARVALREAQRAIVGGDRSAGGSSTSAPSGGRAPATRRSTDAAARVAKRAAERRELARLEEVVQGLLARLLEADRRWVAMGGR